MWHVLQYFETSVFNPGQKKCWSTRFWVLFIPRCPDQGWSWAKLNTCSQRHHNLMHHIPLICVQHLTIGPIYASTHRYSSKTVEAMATHYSQHLHNTFLTLDCFSKHHLKIHVKLRHQQQDQNTHVNAESFQQPQRTPNKFTSPELLRKPNHWG